MEFVLNDYHRNLSDDELIQDVVRVAKELKKDSITGEEYDKYGKYHSSTVRRRLGTWKKILELAHLKTKGHPFKCDYSIEDIKTDIERVLKILGQKTLTRDEYNLYGKYSGATIAKKYGGWNNVLKICNLDIQYIHSIPEIDLLAEIERLWILLGRQPTTTDIKSGISKYSLNAFTRKFGGWRNALIYFINYINDEKVENTENIVPIKVSCNKEKSETNLHQTSRDINLRLRFKVMARDNFKCCICGASPATNPNVILHIDHIKPWAKGGETVLDNLQTLCSKCNLGKSDLDMEN